MRSVLQWVFWFAAMTIVMRWFARSREVRTSDESAVLRHPPSMLVLGLVAGVLSVLAAVFSFGAATGGPGVATFFLTFSGLGAYWVAEYYVVRFHVREDALEYRTLFGRGVMPWREITRISWSEIAKWLVIETRGQRVRVSALLRNLPVLARTILEHVPREHVDAEAWALVDRIAEGRLPQIWG